MCEILKIDVFIFMWLQNLSPQKMVVKWLKTCHMVVEMKVQVSFLTSYNCD